MQSLLILVPCFNEIESIDALVSEVKRVMTPLSNRYQWQLLLVDDGSQDGTVERIKALAAENDFIRYIRFTRNFSHQSALLAGLHHSRTDIVITMDADLQQPPRYIPEFLELHNKGFEIVSGKRKTKPGWSIKKATSRLFYALMNRISETPLEPDTPDFRLYGPKILNVIRSYNEHDLFLRGYVQWLGFSQTTLEYEQADRVAGTSKYSWKKMFSFAINGVTSMTAKPLRWISSVGLFLMMVPLLYGAYVVYLYIVHPEVLVSGWLSIVMLLIFFQGITFLFLGIIAAYLSQIYNETKGRPNYVIDEKKI